MTRTPDCPEDDVLVLRGLALLDEDELRAVDRHLASCPRCAARVGSFDLPERGAELSTRLGHVPATLLARRPERITELPPRARAAIEHHLEHCISCREEADVLGRLRARPVAIADTGPPAVIPPRFPPRPRGYGLLAGYAALATAAAVVLALRGPLVAPPAPPAPVATRAPATTVTPPAADVAPAPAPVPEVPAAAPAGPRAWSVSLVPRAARPLVPTMRGAAPAGSSARLARGPERGALLVRVEPLLDAEDMAPVVIELLDRDARVLSRTRVRARELHGGREILLGTGAAAIPAGSYTLRFRTEASADAAGDSIDYPFELEGEG